MGEIRNIGEKVADARHWPVERALENASAAHAEKPATRAVAVLVWIDGDRTYVRPYCAGVELTQALGVLELAKQELLYGGGE